TGWLACGGPVSRERPLGGAAAPRVNNETRGPSALVGAEPDEPRIRRHQRILGAEREPPLPLADDVEPPERRFLPERLEPIRERKVVPGHRVLELGVLARGLRREHVLFGVVEADALTDHADGVLIGALDGVVEREAESGQPEDQVSARLERKDTLGAQARARVVAPVLSDGGEVR